MDQKVPSPYGQALQHNTNINRSKNTMRANEENTIHAKANTKTIYLLRDYSYEAAKAHLRDRLCLQDMKHTPMQWVGSQHKLCYQHDVLKQEVKSTLIRDGKQTRTQFKKRPLPTIMTEDNRKKRFDFRPLPDHKWHFLFSSANERTYQASTASGKKLRTPSMIPYSDQYIRKINQTVFYINGSKPEEKLYKVYSLSMRLYPIGTPDVNWLTSAVCSGPMIKPRKRLRFHFHTMKHCQTLPPTNTLTRLQEAGLL